MLLISFIFFLSSSSHLSCSFYSSTTSRSSQDTLANLLKKFEIESFKLFWKGFNSEKEREGQAIGWEGPTLWAAIISSYQFSRLIEAVIKFNPFLPNHPYRSTPIAPIHRSRIFHDWLRPQIPRFLSCGISLALDLTLDLTNFVLISSLQRGGTKAIIGLWRLSSGLHSEIKTLSNSRHLVTLDLVQREIRNKSFARKCIFLGSDFPLLLFSTDRWILNFLSCRSFVIETNLLVSQ